MTERWKRKAEFESEIVKILDIHRAYGFNRYELLYVIVKRLVPEMIEKPRLWEKFLKKIKRNY